MTHFINKSNETIPPFACMQICIPPKDWEEINKKPITEATKQLMINGGVISASQLPRYDQDTVLYCIKPNLITALYQDASTLAFNGPSYIEADKQGVCTIGEYPAKAISTNFTYPYSALGPAANSWRLFTTFSEYGAFRELYPTTHELKLRTNSPLPAEAAPNFLKFIGANNLKKARLPMRTRGTIQLKSGDNTLNGIAFLGEWPDRFRSEDEAYFLIHSVPTGFGTLTESKISWFQQGRLQIPGLYELRIAGRLAIKDVPEGVTSVPINLSLRFDQDGGSGGGFTTVISGGDIALTVNPYVASEFPTVLKWPEIAFRTTYFIQYLGRTGRFAYENKSSPYVQVAGESNTITFDLFRMNWEQFLRTQYDDYRSDLFFREVPANPFFDQVYFLDPNRRTQIMFFAT